MIVGAAAAEPTNVNAHTHPKTATHIRRADIALDPFRMDNARHDRRKQDFLKRGAQSRAQSRATCAGSSIVQSIIATASGSRKCSQPRSNNQTKHNPLRQRYGHDRARQTSQSRENGRQGAWARAGFRGDVSVEPGRAQRPGTGAPTPQVTAQSALVADVCASRQGLPSAYHRVTRSLFSLSLRLRLGWRSRRAQRRSGRRGSRRSRATPAGSRRGSRCLGCS